MDVSRGSFRVSKRLTLVLLCAAGTVALTAYAAVEIAKVNGRAITAQDVQMALSGFNEGQRSTILRDPNSRRQILSNLIDQEVLVLQAEKEKLDQNPEFKAALAAFRKQYLANQLVAKNVQAKVTEAEAKKYYSSHKSRFSTDEVHVQHILLEDEKRAMDVLTQARAPNADFQKLAETLSIDPSAKNNRGDIGVMTRDSPFVAEFKDAAFNGDVGSIVGPVKTAYGYHLIKVVEKKVGRALNYDEVELKVKDALRQELARDYVNRLKSAAKVTINEKALNSL